MREVDHAFGPERGTILGTRSLVSWYISAKTHFFIGWLLCPQKILKDLSSNWKLYI